MASDTPRIVLDVPIDPPQREHTPVPTQFTDVTDPVAHARQRLADNPDALPWVRAWWERVARGEVGP